MNHFQGQGSVSFNHFGRNSIYISISSSITRTGGGHKTLIKGMAQGMAIGGILLENGQLKGSGSPTFRLLRSAGKDRGEGFGGSWN